MGRRAPVSVALAALVGALALGNVGCGWIISDQSPIDLPRTAEPAKDGGVSGKPSSEVGSDAGARPPPPRLTDGGAGGGPVQGGSPNGGDDGQADPAGDGDVPNVDGQAPADDAGPPVADDAAPDPARDVGAPPNNDDASAPTPSDAGTPPIGDDASPPPSGDAGAPPTADDASPAPVSDSSTPPSGDDVGPPPIGDDAGTPPSSDAGSPPDASPDASSDVGSAAPTISILSPAPNAKAGFVPNDVCQPLGVSVRARAPAGVGTIIWAFFTPLSTSPREVVGPQCGGAMVAAFELSSSKYAGSTGGVFSESMSIAGLYSAPSSTGGGTPSMWCAAPGTEGTAFADPFYGVGSMLPLSSYCYSRNTPSDDRPDTRWKLVVTLIDAAGNTATDTAYFWIWN